MQPFITSELVADHQRQLRQQARRYRMVRGFADPNRPSRRLHRADQGETEGNADRR
jgi:hypothetical protein